jgi:osmoprotectant transport system permease protein
VGEGSGLVIAPALYAQVGEAVSFIFERQPSVSGDVEIGGLGEIGSLTVSHLAISFAAVAIGAAIAMPLGLYLGHIGKGEFAAVSVSNVGRAVPVLALLAFFIAYTGIGFQTVIIVLILLAIPPILTNSYVGVRQVEREAVDAARGMGLSEGQIVRQVEFPMALPIIFGALRLSTINVVATATIAPLANFKTLGTPIIEPQTYGIPGQIGAAIVIAVIALVLYALLGALQSALTPKGLKLAAAQAAGGRGLFSFLRRRPQAT